MNATATNSKVAAARRSTRSANGNEPPHPETTALVRQAPQPLRDDESHTPPHGDAVLSQSKPAR